MWYFFQKTGTIKHDGLVEGWGYSGKDEGKNNPEMQEVPFKGVIPRGIWYFGTPRDSVEHGPEAIPLTPDISTETFGRRGFMMHGDSIEHPGCASEGCICTSRNLRDLIVSSMDNELTVL